LKRSGQLEPVPDEEPPAGTFAARFLSKQVDYNKIIREGIPEREWHANHRGILAKRKRYLIAAPTKVGKSLSLQAQFVDMALNGERIMDVDKENGVEEWSRRMQDIYRAYDLTDEERDIVGRNLLYFGYPTLRDGDGRNLVDLCGDLAIDIVCFDSQRKVLSDLGLHEDVSDDYSHFVNDLIDPLWLSGVTTIILDNTGHRNLNRPRATSSKIDLPDVVFSMTTLAEFDQDRVGKVQLKTEHSRIGNWGIWTMVIGGGTFEPWKSMTGPDPGPTDDERVLGVLAVGKQKSGTQIEKALNGTGIGSAKVRRALARLVASERLLLSKGAHNAKLYTRTRV
jgi:hypothetical protein